MKNKKFICDNCGEIIEKVSDGWIEWYNIIDEEGNKVRDGLRLVHHITCMYNSQELHRQGKNISDMHLEYFMGDDGLMILLALLGDDYYNFLNPNDVIEMIKRLHIPNYEETRLYLREAISNGVYEPNTHIDFPYQFQMELVKEAIKNGTI